MIRFPPPMFLSGVRKVNQTDGCFNICDYVVSGSHFLFQNVSAKMNGDRERGKNIYFLSISKNNSLGSLMFYGCRQRRPESPYIACHFGNWTISLGRLYDMFLIYSRFLYTHINDVILSSIKFSAVFQK